MIQIKIDREKGKENENIERSKREKEEQKETSVKKTRQ